MQVFFAKKSIKNQVLQQKSGSGTGHTALIRFYVYKNDVRADPFDAIPGDHEVVPLPKQSPKPAGAGHNKGCDTPLRQLDDGIIYKAQPPPVVNTNDFLAMQVGKSV